MSRIMSYEALYNELSMEEKTNSRKPSQFYFFMRLYNAVYKSKLNPVSTLDKAIKFVDQKTNDPVGHFNHAACSYKLTDDFVGLTTKSNGEPSAVKIESCEVTDYNRYMKSTDIEKSEFAIYALPITEEEWNKVKHFLDVEIHDPKIMYGTLSLVSFAIDKVGKKIAASSVGQKLASTPVGNKIFGKEDAEAEEPKITKRDEKMMVGKKDSLVCSSFVGYTLNKCTSYKNAFDRTGTNFHLLAPSDLSRIPGAKYICSGRFKDYNKVVSRAVKGKPLEMFYTPFLSEVRTGCSPTKK